jgi:hypothetical protein
VISNLEAKRAQGFLDTDVLVGRAVKAYRIIGNSVCRQVAFALSESLAEAVRKTPKVEKSKVIELVGHVLRERTPRPRGHYNTITLATEEVYGVDYEKGCEEGLYGFQWGL